MLADQENQENIPPPSGKAAPAGPRVALGLLRGPRQRPGAPLQAAAGRGQQPLGIRVDQPNGGKQPFAIRVDEVGGEKQPFSIHVDQPDAGKKPFAVRVDQPGGGKQPFAIHVDQPDGGKQPFSICLDEPDGGKQPFAIHVDKAGRGKQPLRIRVDEQDVRKQPFAILVDEPDKEKKPFSIHVDEPDEQQQRRQRRESPVAPKEDEEENALGLREAVCALGERRPLATLSNAVEMSFDSPSIMDISINPEEEEEEETPNVNNVPDYINDIHTYLREMEMKCKPKMGYMKKQPDITNNMRAILVDWLVEVGEEYKLQNETLHLAVNYIDRFLSSMSVLRGKLQLVGTAAMLLASKFEEIYPPEVAEFVYITDDTYTKKQVLRMEHLILKVLSFDLAAPTINQFLTQYFLHQQTNAKVESLAMYLGELSLIDADPYLKYLPSVIAAAAFHLAGYTITGQTWYLKNGNTDIPFLGRQRHLLMHSEEDHQNKVADSFLMVHKRVPESLCKVTGYTLEDIKPCLMDLHQTYLKAAQHTQQSIREKYKSTKYHGVSLIDAPETLNLL